MHISAVYLIAFMDAPAWRAHMYVPKGAKPASRVVVVDTAVDYTHRHARTHAPTCRSHTEISHKDMIAYVRHGGIVVRYVSRQSAARPATTSATTAKY